MQSPKLTGLKHFFCYIDSDAVADFVDLFDINDQLLITLMEFRIKSY